MTHPLPFQMNASWAATQNAWTTLSNPSRPCGAPSRPEDVERSSHDDILRTYAPLETSWGRARLNARAVIKGWLWKRMKTGKGRMKRRFDMVFSLAALILLSPVIGLLALLIKWEDGGPVFFSQKRTGEFGREFNAFKLRSMCVNAEERLKEVLGNNRHREGVTFKLENDPRITRVGRWMRRYSLDELPQFYNVLIGDMSIVGPRPPLPREVALYSPADRRRLRAKPGITCLWQIGGRSEIDFSGQVALDVQYIERQTLWEDLKIVAKTVPAVISGRGAC